MITERRQSMLILAVVALIILNISTLGTILYQRNREVKKDKETGRMKIQGQENFSGRYFHERLNLSPDQMNEFQKFNPTFRQQAREINDNLMKLRSRMLEEMANKESDTNTLNSLSDSIGLFHSSLKKITFRYYLDLKFICTASQQKQLEKLFSETFSSDVQRGYGNRFRNRGRMSVIK